MHELKMVAVVMVGGGFGALARFLIAEIVRTATPWPPHVATLAANVIGCFGIGVAYVFLERADRPLLGGLLVIGLLGAFTTFSAFGLDAMHLLHDRRFGELATYLSASVLLGLVAVKLGMLVAAGPPQ